MTKKLKLVSLQKSEMAKLVTGGCKCEWGCGCACKYADSGGSSTDDNWDANAENYLYSPGCCEE